MSIVVFSEVAYRDSPLGGREKEKKKRKVRSGNLFGCSGTFILHKSLFSGFFLQLPIFCHFIPGGTKFFFCFSPSRAHRPS